MANLQTFEHSEYQQVKADLHRKILDRLDLEKLGRSNGDTAREEVLVLIRNAVNNEIVPLSFAERERLSREILDEIFGLGPLEPLLKDHTISDILVNRYDKVYIERERRNNRVDAGAIGQAGVHHGRRFIDAAAHAGNNALDDLHEMLIVFERKSRQLQFARPLDINLIETVYQDVGDGVIF